MLKFLELFNKHGCPCDWINIPTVQDARENVLVFIIEEMEIAGLIIADMKNKIKSFSTESDN